MCKVISGFDKQIQKNPKSLYLYQEKIQTYLNFDRMSQARQTCKEALRAMPDNPWAIQANACILADETSFDEAEKMMNIWIKQNESFSRYLDIAYFCYLNSHPQKATEAINKSLEYGIVTGDDDILSKGYTIAVSTLRAENYDSVIQLCDHLLTINTNTKRENKGLLELKSTAQKAKNGKPFRFVWFYKMKLYSPFYTFNLASLLGHDLPHLTTDSFEKQ